MSRLVYSFIISRRPDLRHESGKDTTQEMATNGEPTELVMQVAPIRYSGFVPVVTKTSKMN